MGLVLLLAEGLLLAWGLAVGYAWWTLTHPPRRTYTGAVARGRPGDPGELTPVRAFSEFTVRSRGRTLPAWHIPGDAADGPVVVLTHGWGDSRLGALVRLGALLPSASAVIAWDLPGHGESPGRSDLGTREAVDLLAVLETVGEDRPIVLYGWSLGAGVSLVAAARSERVKGVIAEAPYRLAITPARNVMRLRRLPHAGVLEVALGIIGLLRGAGVRWKRPHGPLREEFDRAVVAARVRCPVLVVHGTLDEVCPVEDGRAIAHAAGGRIVEVAEGHHNDLWTDGAVCGEAVGEFLRQERQWARGHGQ